MGREAAGVRGVKLNVDQRVNGADRAEQGFILTASQTDSANSRASEEFPARRGGRRDRPAITDRNGRMVGALQVSVDDEIMLMSQNGGAGAHAVKDISVVGRNTQGVRLIRLEEAISSRARENRRLGEWTRRTGTQKGTQRVGKRRAATRTATRRPRL